MTVASKTPEWLAWQNSLPAVLVDVQQIQGNVSEEEKQINANIFAYFCTGSGLTKFPPFNTKISRGFRVVGFSVWEDTEKGSAEGEAVFEIEVTKEMSNVYGTLHGGCAAVSYFSVAPPGSCRRAACRTTVAAMVLLGRAKGFDGTGVSITMNIHWHHAAPLYVSSF
ncbi:hypothetical protein R3P38DRAFT_2509353 [Favolaschia claudopus]|uniref:Uncharacterized protein n=1 Tax=Favolaschia claudopus TaxID=2862362 RepID=A0AAW0CYR8_9AGAR